MKTITLGNIDQVRLPTVGQWQCPICVSDFGQLPCHHTRDELRAYLQPAAQRKHSENHIMRHELPRALTELGSALDEAEAEVEE